MLFPISGVEVNPLIPFIVAFFVSFFTSMGGVSGAFLLLPFQVSFLGYTAPSVSGTNQVFNIVATPSVVYRYIKEGRMLWPLTWAVIIGTLPGVFIGAWYHRRNLRNRRRRHCCTVFRSHHRPSGLYCRRGGSDGIIYKFSKKTSSHVGS